MRTICLLLGVLSWSTAAVAQYNPELGETGDNTLDADAEASASASSSDLFASGDDGTSDADGESAGGGVDYSGSLRLGLDVILLSLTSESYSVDDSSQDVSSLDVGIVPSGLGLNLGYAFLEQFVVGARVQVSSSSTSVGNNDTSSTTWGILPYFEWVFTPGETIEWLVLGTLGLRGASISELQTDISQMLFSFGVGGGAHIMLGEVVSLDPVIEVGAGLGSRDQGATTYDVSGFQLGARVGLSVWL